MGRDLADARAIRDDRARARSRGGGEFSAAIQPQRPRAARSGRSRALGDNRRRRRPHRHRPALAPLGVSRALSASRDPVSLDSLSRHDPMVGWRAVGRVLSDGRASGRCRSCATRAARSSSTTAIASDVRWCMNHTHRAGPKYRASEMTVEGLDGAARLTWGVNLSYPYGPADTMEVALDGKGWQPVPLRGSWFTEAFEGPMSNLQRFAAGEDADRWSARWTMRSRRWRLSSPAMNQVFTARRRYRRGSRGNPGSANRCAPAFLALRSLAVPTGSIHTWRPCAATFCRRTYVSRWTRWAWTRVSPCRYARRSRKPAGCCRWPMNIPSSLA